MSPQRPCSRPSCRERAVATLTYVYADCTAVLGPLAETAEPHCYDLCDGHASKLTAPRGWDVVRLDFDPYDFAQSHDDLEALANAVREAARPRPEVPQAPPVMPPGTVEVGRRGHLRVLRAAE